MTDVEAAHRVDAVTRSVGRDGPRGLGEDVERVVVARDRQRAVSLLVPVDEAEVHRRDAVHADSLRGDPDECVAAFEDLAAVAAEEVVARAHVVPRHDHRAVEPRRVVGPVDDEPGLERLRLARLDRPLPVAIERRARDWLVPRGSAFEEELLLGEAVCGEVDHWPTERPTVRAASDRSRDAHVLLLDVAVRTVAHMAQADGPGISRRGLLAAGAVAAVVPRLGIPRRALPRAPVSVAPGLAIWPRDAWAPAAPTGPLAAEDVRFLLVHHTAANTEHRAEQVPGLLAAMYQFHTGEKGWHDIAYNFLVDREGGVWEGRAGSLAGPVAADATGGSQGFDQLVCFIGDFTSVMPTPAALDAGTRTLAWLAQRYGIDTSAGSKVTFVSRGSNKWPAGAKVTTSTVAGHRDMSTTACPGNAFYPYVRNDLQSAVNGARGGAPAAPASTAAPATTAPATTQAASTTRRPPRRRSRPRRSRPRRSATTTTTACHRPASTVIHLVDHLVIHLGPLDDWCDDDSASVG